MDRGGAGEALPCGDQFGAAEGCDAEDFAQVAFGNVEGVGEFDARFQPDFGAAFGAGDVDVHSARFQFEEIEAEAVDSEDGRIHKATIPCREGRSIPGSGEGGDCGIA